MPSVQPSINAPPTERLNVTDRLAHFAAIMPDTVALACVSSWSSNYRIVTRESGATYAVRTFAELDADTGRIARGFTEWGVPQGTRLALLVRPGIEFVTLVFALLRAGMVSVLIDPGIGRRNLIGCLSESKPHGFVAVPAAQGIRVLLRRRFPLARWNVTVGRRWFWGGKTLDQLRGSGNQAASLPSPRSVLRATLADDAAAIIFTSGSTGPPKGVLYTHRMFDTQVAEIQSMYDISPGGIDLGCFPLFALFNAAMGVTSLLPEMDFSRPATAEPKKLLAAANDWHVTQAFASPAVWRALSNYCATTGERIPSLRQVFCCGAPVPASVLKATLECVAYDAKMHTPYGATECLPVSTIEAAEVLGATAARTDGWAGVCVGRKFDSIDWRVIRITDEPIERVDEIAELTVGEIGELIVRGPQVSPTYVTRLEANKQHKIPIAALGLAESKIQSEIRNPKFETGSWHRTGDVGYFDREGRFWYCGRKTQRVVTQRGTLFTECVEAIFNQHPDIEMSALVGVGPAGDQLPVIAIKFKRHVRITRYSGRHVFPDFEQLAAQVRSAAIPFDWLDFDEFRVDVRHNSKIDREFLRRGVVMGVLLGPDVFSNDLLSRAKEESSQAKNSRWSTSRARETK